MYIKDEFFLLFEKLDKIDRTASSVQTECACLDNEISKVKKIIGPMNYELTATAHTN